MEYQMKDVCKIVEIKMSQAQYWTRLGLVSADITGPTTQGVARLFSLRNILEFSIIKQLTQNGIKAERIAKILKDSRIDFPDFWEKPGVIILETENQPILIYYSRSKYTAYSWTTVSRLLEKGLGHVGFWGEFKLEDTKGVPLRGFPDVLQWLLRYPCVLLLNCESIKRELLARV